MTYTRNPTWVDGSSALTAARMENIEAGILGADAPAIMTPPVVGNTVFRDSNNAASLPTGAAYGTPYHIPIGIPVARVIINVSTAEVGKVARVGIYNSTPATGLPATVISLSDIPLDTTGDKAIEGPFVSQGSLLWVFFFAPVATTATLLGSNNNRRDAFSIVSLGNNAPAVIASSFPANPVPGIDPHGHGQNPWWTYQY